MKSLSPTRLAALFLMVLGLPACFVARQSTNEPLAMRAVSGLEPGRSTARDVVNLLGAPNDVVQLGKRTAYQYVHTIEKDTGLFLLILGFGNVDSRQDRVWLFFDENETLTHLGSTFSSHRPQYAMPWEDIHEASDNDSRDEDRREEEGLQ
ncbi:MAG: hypothetical protein RL885_14215 [Planctomycetota bacterium]